MRGLRVDRVGCLVLVEDRGRPGYAHLGVPHSGALDEGALGLANRLVGNRADDAGLEVLLGGIRVVAEESLRIALTGAHLALRVDGRAVPWGAAVSVASGSAIEVGTAPGALRGWLAVAGGIDVPLTLGSRSTDTLSGLGPKPVQQGDFLPVGTSSATPPVDAVVVAALTTAGPTTLRVRLGPRDDWFTPASLDTLLGSQYDVTAASNRVAVRFRGDSLVRRTAGELASEGLVRGAVQVPGDGEPLIFLADHPTTGGYPVVGVVASDDLWKCAQLRPGDSVRFVAA